MQPITLLDVSYALLLLPVKYPVATKLKEERPYLGSMDSIAATADQQQQVFQKIVAQAICLNSY